MAECGSTNRVCNKVNRTRDIDYGRDRISRDRR